MKRKRKKNFNIYYIIAPLLIIISFSLVWFFLYIASQRNLSSLENIFLQIFILTTSLAGSFLLGKIFSQNSAYDAIKPHARSAFRRVLALYGGLSRLAKSVDNEINVSKKNNALEKIKAILIEQLATADDALEDWNDIVPEEVEEIESRLYEKRYPSKKSTSNEGKTYPLKEGTSNEEEIYQLKEGTSNEEK